ncbi:glycoside hydrolase family 3 protein [Erythrobacter arachoides]|uniref:beta-glucosidase n=1 Tax=Aurantiacibacter arachoides TaxID=1850444 RepID=A0A845A2L3_9SPHN|nr:glycoside hydrolase family 3 N-terminal domain-containing protein [Aurantiacibacter arachoides]MXO93830.1 glycoside hydrolase family 3 protein [Aurantiacibacter arachoides]GGD46373.1 beta-glucosidase [Aurantiacibacter arachoides]
MIRRFVTLAAGAAALAGCTTVSEQVQPALGWRVTALVTVDGLHFRDLDRDHALTPYEDWRLSPEERAADLLARMTLAEKAGQMIVATAPNNAPPGQPATGYDTAALARIIAETHATHFISRLSTRAEPLAEANNALQEAAEAGRLGIPAVVMTDPRHGFTELAGASVAGGSFAQFPNGVGIAALGDADVTRRYADLVRLDLRATGFSMLLGPQIDLATEPRWPRNFDTFGEDAAVSASMAAAFVEGLQGAPDGVTTGGVAAVVKHFAGYSASANGFDAHNWYGRFSRLDAAEWEQHIRPFEGALAARPAGVMPAYSILQELELDGAPLEQVGVGYNERILRGQLRGRLGFDGVIVSDWAITKDCTALCRDGHPVGEPPSFATVSTAWGVENLTETERFAKGIAAGIDVFGGVDDPALIIAAVEQGLVSEVLVDAAVTRVLVQAFALGLFENPYVDPAHTRIEVGTAEDEAFGREMQGRSMVLLEGAPTLREGSRVLLSGVDPEAARAAGFVPVTDARAADAAILRTRSPFELLHPGYMFGSLHQEGSLAFPANHPALAFASNLPAGLPLVVDVQLDRPAVLTPLTIHADTVLASFGASDHALMDVLRGRTRPEGRLPFELPRSMEAVEAQRPGTAADSADPLYPLGYRARR